MSQPDIQLSCATCFQDTVLLQGASIAKSIEWLFDCAMGAAGSGNQRPVPAGGFVLCSVTPACEALNCEVPVCRDELVRQCALQEVKAMFRTGGLGSPDVETQLLRGALAWSQVEVPIHRHESLKVGTTGFHCALIANNILAASFPSSDNSPSVVMGEVEAASRASFNEVEAKLCPASGDFQGIEAADLIALHLLCRGLQVIEAAPEKEADPTALEAASCLAVHLNEWDVLGNFGTWIFSEEGTQMSDAEIARLARILRSIQRSSGGAMIITRIGRDIGRAVQFLFDPARQTGGSAEPEPAILRLAELFERLMDDDRDFSGTLIATNFLTELLHLKFVSVSVDEELDREGAAKRENPLWEILATEWEGEVGFRKGMPAFLARLMRLVSARRITRRAFTRPREDRVIERFKSASRIMIPSPYPNEQFWHLFVVRYLRQILGSREDGLRFPPGCELSLMGGCRLVEEVAESYESRRKSELDGMIRETCRSVFALGTFVRSPMVVEGAELLEVASRDLRKGLEERKRRSGFLDEYFAGLIASGRIWTRGGLDEPGTLEAEVEKSIPKTPFAASAEAFRQVKADQVANPNQDSPLDRPARTKRKQPPRSRRR